MKNNTIFKLSASLVAFAMLLSASFTTAYASVTPSLSLAAASNGDSVQVNVNADPNLSVILFYTPTNSTLQIRAIGTTNSSGTFSTTISSSAYGLTTNNPVYISVGGVNGVVSPTVLWPSVNATSANPITLSKTGLVLSVGQTSTISVTNNTGNALFISNNSNSSVASAAISGNQITFLALGYGTTAVTVCTVGSTVNCPSVFITVQNGNTQTLSLSQNNVSLAYGQSVAVTISGGTGTYIVSNNSSSGNVSTSINGNVVVLGGSSSSSGTYAVTVCSSDMSSCGIINVTLGSTNSPSVSFSQSSPTLSVGQSLTISVYGNTTTTYYISSNSNASVVQSSILNNVITLYGVSNGTSMINVCASSGGCSSMTVTVNNASNVSPVYLSQSSMTSAVGQTQSVSISGGTAPYTLLTTSNSIFQAGISGSSLFVTGAGVGSAQITVCSSNSTGCASLSLQVNGTGVTTNTTTPTTTVGTSFLNFTTVNPVLSVGQSSSITVSGGLNSGYSVAYNSNSSTVQASINGNVLSLYGLRNGSVVIVVCDASSNCGALSVSVGSTSTPTSTNTDVNIVTTNGIYPSGCVSSSGFSITTGLSCGSGTTSTTVTTPVQTTPSAVKYQFSGFLNQGSTGNEVLELQKKLSELGYYNGPENGNYGPMTAAGVKAYQRAHGITAAGYVGPSTRAALNAD